jgi:hypothetical protein
MRGSRQLSSTDAVDKTVVFPALMLSPIRAAKTASILSGKYDRISIAD